MKRLSDEEKPREKAYLYGIETLTNQELLAVILCTGSRNHDALELAQLLLNETGTLEMLSGCTIQELSLIDGIKRAKALKIKAALELHSRIEKEKAARRRTFASMAEVAEFFLHQGFDRTRECLQIVLLNQKGEILSHRILTTGSSGSVTFSPNQIVAIAVKVFAKKIILAHNHPSGICTPSKKDAEETQKLMLIASMIGIELIDHLILTDTEYFSIFENQRYRFPTE